MNEIENTKDGTTEKIQWFKRKRYLVDAPLQLKIILRFTIVALIFIVVISILSYKWVLDLRSLFDGTLFGPMKPIEAFQIVADKLLYRFIGIMIAMFFSFLIVGVYTTYRFAGPIWKLQRDLHKFFDGEDISNIRFRKHDDYQELPGLINKLVSGYKGPRNKGPTQES